MLTADTLWFSRRGERIVPRLLDPKDPGLRAAAAALIDLVRSHIGRRRGELEAALRAYRPPGLHPKAGRGLTRLVLEKCSFEAVAADAPGLRAALCDAAADSWRNHREPGSSQWRNGLLDRAAREWGITREIIEDALFADLAENQLLARLEGNGPEKLLLRFNTAQVQGILLAADRVWVEAPWPPPRRLRQLFRYLKFFGLLYSQPESSPSHGGDPGRLLLEIDGPLSLLESGAIYGLQLAQFFPALLLWREDWSLRADVRMGKARRPGVLEVLPHPWLRSHYPDQGQWVPEENSRFVQAFNDQPSPWKAAPAEDVLMLPGNRALVPDFVFRHGETGREVYLEHLLYPVADRVAARLQQIGGARRDDYLLACRGVPSVRNLAAPCPPLVVFRRNLRPGIVKAALAAFEE